MTRALCILCHAALQAAFAAVVVIYCSLLVYGG